MAHEMQIGAASGIRGPAWAGPRGRRRSAAVGLVAITLVWFFDQLVRQIASRILAGIAVAPISVGRGAQKRGLQNPAVDPSGLCSIDLKRRPTGFRYKQPRPIC